MRTNTKRIQITYPYVPAFSAVKSIIYKPLLYSIAIQFGMGQREAETSAHYICSTAEKHYRHEGEGLTLKTWLCKTMIRDCVFKLSSKMFILQDNTYGVYALNSSLTGLSVLSMPLTLRIVYILCNSNEFTETEVTKILNITPVQMKERLAKATRILHVKA